MNLTINVLQDNGIGNAPSPLVVPIGGITIGGVSNGSGVSTFTAIVVDNTSVDLAIVAGSGFINYSNTINNVYFTDTTIEIIILPKVTDISDPYYNRPIARFFTFPRPCGLYLDIYNASSFSGNVSYYVNNELEGHGSNIVANICNSGEYQIKQRVTTNRYVQGCPSILMWDRQWASDTIGETGNTVAETITDISEYLLEDTETNVIVLDFKPSFVTEKSLSTYGGEESCCYGKGEEVTISSVISINKEWGLEENYILTYVVENPLGEEVINISSTLDDPTLDFTLDLEELGTYKVTATLEDTECNKLYTNILQISTCNFITITTNSCGEFTVANRSTDTEVTLFIENILGEEVLPDTLVESQEEIVLTFEKVNLYKVSVSYVKGEEVKTETYIIHNFCIIENCIGDYIKDLLCKDKERCDPCPDETELNQILLLSYSFFMKLNKEYSFNNFYNGLDQSKLEELISIKQVGDKLVEFCARRGCISSSFSANITKNTTYTLKNVVQGCTSCGG